MQVSSVSKTPIRYTCSCVTTTGTSGTTIVSLINIHIYMTCGWGMSIFGRVPLEISGVQQHVNATSVNKNVHSFGVCLTSALHQQLVHLLVHNLVRFNIIFIK